MQRRELIKAIGAISVIGPGAARAQAWPARPIRLIVPFPPGGPTDSFARIYAEAMSRQGMTMVVENKAGASGAIGTVEVKRSAADGYTLLFGTASTHALYNLVEARPQYDSMEDFDYVAVLGGAPLVFVVSPSMPRTLKTVIIAARHNPGKYSYGSPGSGTLMHIATELLKQSTGAPITHVPYRGSAPALQDLMGGIIEMTVDTLGSALPHHQSGRVRILAVSAPKRYSLAPDVATVAESADLDKPFSAMLWNVVTAPRGTPADVMAKLSQATQRVLSDPALRAKLESQAMFVDLHAGNAAARAFVEAEREKLRPVVAALGDALKR